MQTDDERGCGTISIGAYIVESGITSTYFANRWFSSEVAGELVTKDFQINFNWANDIIPDLASDYVSIIWEGLLLPEYSEDYTFYIDSNDGVRLEVAG